MVVTDEEDLAESVMEITGGAGADIVFDPVVGSSLEKIADAAAYQGSIFLYGRLSPEPAVIPLVPGSPERADVPVLHDHGDHEIPRKKGAGEEIHL